MKKIIILSAFIFSYLLLGMDDEEPSRILPPSNQPIKPEEKKIKTVTPQGQTLLGGVQGQILTLKSSITKYENALREGANLTENQKSDIQQKLTKKKQELAQLQGKKD